MKIETKNAAPDMEQKSIPMELKANADGTFEGYASVFENKDSYGDIMRRGAFTKTLQERKGKIKVLWNHDPMHPIGKPLDMKEDNYGLHVRAQILTGLSMGSDVIELMRNGIIDSMSIGYTAIKYNYLSDDNETSWWPGRELLEVKLYEFSPVTFAANESAMITGVKSAGAIEAEIRKWTQILQADFKAGKVLNSRNAQRILDAWKALGEILTEAGVEEAAQEGTSSTDEKSQKPGTSTSVLAELQSVKRQIVLEERKHQIASDLHAFALSLKEN